MKTSARTGAGRIIPLRAPGRAPLEGLPRAHALDTTLDTTNDTRELARRLDATPWRTRAPEHELWRSTHEMPLSGGAWGMQGAGSPRSALAPRIREGRLSAVHICGAAGCSRRAVKPCFDCGEWRCGEHLLAAVHHRKSAVVQLCPTCLQAHVEHPDRLRLDGVEDPRTQRAPHPLLGRESGMIGQTTEVTPLARNTLAQPPAESLWRADKSLTAWAAKPTTKAISRRTSALLERE